MNCDDFLTRMETGGIVSRWRAARHARRCPRCQAAERALRQLKDELGAAPPLSAELRSRWLAAAERPVVSIPPTSNRRRTALWAAALAAVLLIAVALAIRTFNSQQPSGKTDPKDLAHDDHPTPAPPIAREDVRTVGGITIVEIDPASEFARMDERLAQVQDGLKLLALDTERLIAEQRIARLLADHRNWLASSDSNRFIPQ